MNQCFSKSASHRVVSRLAVGVHVCLCVFIFLEIVVMEELSDQPLINNQSPAVSFPPASSTSADNSANVKPAEKSVSQYRENIKTFNDSYFFCSKIHPCLLWSKAYDLLLNSLQ